MGRWVKPSDRYLKAGEEWAWCYYRHCWVKQVRFNGFTGCTCACCGGFAARTVMKFKPHSKGRPLDKIAD